MHRLLKATTILLVTAGLVAPASVASASPVVPGGLTASVEVAQARDVQVDTRATLAVEASLPTGCAGCAVLVGLGEDFWRVGTMDVHGGFYRVVRVATPDRPGYYRTTVRLVSPEGVVAEADSGTLAVHGAVSHRLRSSVQGTTVRRGGRVTVRGQLLGKDIDGSSFVEGFRGTVALQYRNGSRWVTVTTVDARRRTSVTVQAVAVKSADIRLYAVAERTASDPTRITVR